jgi:hypothetical protein
MSKELVLGCNVYMALQYHMEDAFDNPILYDEYVKENTKLFDTYHMLH